MSNYRKGTEIVISNSVSDNGKYGKHKGKSGKVTDYGRSYNTGSVGEIKLDDGTVLNRVGKSVLELKEEYDSRTPVSREDIESKIKEHKSKIEDLEEQINSLNDRLNFMDEYDLDEYDDRYHKADQVLKQMKSNKAHSDKVKAIANLL